MSLATQLRDLATLVDRIEDHLDVDVQSAQPAGGDPDSDLLRADLTVVVPTDALDTAAGSETDPAQVHESIDDGALEGEVETPDPQTASNSSERPSGGTERLEDLEAGDVVEFELSGTSGVHQANVGPVIVDPPFPPANVAEQTNEEQLPGHLQVSLENTDTGTKWCFNREIDPEDGLTGPIEAKVKACIDIRHPPRYRWQDRGTVESLEVVGRAE
ncbi:hypothetical protein [Halobellus rubicundus]|uniref:Uncharacterized protein n=1 Tax=Halobellus rubicundus TaxID=2996466 RepID=A0ABD5MFN5_9EURY